MPRPISRAISSTPLTQAQVRSHAPAVAIIAESIAGRVRYLYELAAGVPAIAADGAVTPLNPQGRIGVDRSGPPWGDALQHPVWIFEGSNAQANAYGEKPVLSFSTNGDKQFITARFVNRPHQSYPRAPYTRGLLAVRGVRTGGAASATATIRAYGPEGQDGPSQSTTLTMATIGTLVTSTEIYLPIDAGYNERIIEVESTSVVPFEISMMTINQAVRRSH